jgi:hypothetical protein
VSLWCDSKKDIRNVFLTSEAQNPFCADY